MKICYAQITYAEDWKDTLANVEAALPYADCCIVVGDESIEDRMQEFPKSTKACLIRRRFADNMPQFRNEYLKMAKKLGADWVIVSDADERFNKYFWKNIRATLQGAGEKGFNILGVRCDEQFEVIDWLPFDSLDRLKESPGAARHSTFYKQLVFRLYPDLEYRGVGIGTVHETWNSPTHAWVPAVPIEDNTTAVLYDRIVQAIAPNRLFERSVFLLPYLRNESSIARVSQVLSTLLSASI